MIFWPRLSRRVNDSPQPKIFSSGARRKLAAMLWPRSRARRTKENGVGAEKVSGSLSVWVCVSSLPAASKKRICQGSFTISTRPAAGRVGDLAVGLGHLPIVVLRQLAGEHQRLALVERRGPRGEPQPHGPRRRRTRSRTAASGSRSYCVAGKLGRLAADERRVELVERQARLADVAPPAELARAGRGVELGDRAGDEVGRIAVLKFLADVDQLADQLGGRGFGCERRSEANHRENPLDTGGKLERNRRSLCDMLERTPWLQIKKNDERRNREDAALAGPVRRDENLPSTITAKNAVDNWRKLAASAGKRRIRRRLA